MVLIRYFTPFSGDVWCVTSGIAPSARYSRLAIVFKMHALLPSDVAVLISVFMAGSILQIEPDILDRAMDFKQIPVIQKPNVSVQSRTMNQPRNLLAIGKALGCLSSADFLNFSGSPG